MNKNYRLIDEIYQQANSMFKKHTYFDYFI